MLYKSAGAETMEESLSSKSHTSILVRTQRVRARMALEDALGVSAANKELFLSLCRQYEQGHKPIFADSSISASNWERQRQWNKERIWDDWSDWHQKPSPAPPKITFL